VNIPPPPRWLYVALPLACLALTAALLAPACVSTPAGLRLEAPAATAIEAAIAEACPLEAMIPVAGPDLVLACPAQVAAAQAAVALDTAPADAGAAPAVHSLVVQGMRVGVRVRSPAPALPPRVLPLADAGAVVAVDGGGK
jgi:hypothetical protein